MRSGLGVMTLLLAIALVGPTRIATYAQDKGDRVAGTVQLINKETKTILVSGEANNKQMQVTYDDKPLYFYVNEGPNEVRCHNVNLNGGLWWVVGANGKRLP